MATKQYWQFINGATWNNTETLWTDVGFGLGTLQAWQGGEAVFDFGAQASANVSVDGSIPLTGITVQQTTAGSDFYIGGLEEAEFEVVDSVLIQTFSPVSMEVAIPIVGTGSVTYSTTYSGNQFSLTAKNSYTGGTTIKSDTMVSLGFNGELYAGGAVTVEEGAYFSVGGSALSVQIGTLSGGGEIATGSNPLSVGVNTLANDYSVFSGNFVSTNNGSLKKVGAGTLVLDGDNPTSHIVQTEVDGGQLVLKCATALGDTAVLVVNDAGTLVVSDTDMGALDITATGIVRLANLSHRSVGNEPPASPKIQLNQNAKLIIDSVDETVLGKLGINGGADTQIEVSSELQATVNIGSIYTQGSVSIENTELGLVSANFVTSWSTIAGQVSGNGSISLRSENNNPTLATLALSGDNSGFTGGVTIAGATLTLKEASSAGTGTLTFAEQSRNLLEVSANGVDALISGLDADDTIDLQKLNARSTTITKTLSQDGKLLTVSDGTNNVVLKFADALDQRTQFLVSEDDFDHSVLLKMDALDLEAPVATLYQATIARGTSVSVTSSEEGTVYLVRADKIAEVTGVDALATLITSKFAAKAGASATGTLISGSVDTTGLALGSYVAVAVDKAENVSSASADAVKILAMPEVTVSETPLSFTENGKALVVASDLTLTDADGSVPYRVEVRLLDHAPSRFANDDNGSDISIQGRSSAPPESESLVFTANPALFGEIQGTYNAEEGVLKLVDFGGESDLAATLAQWQAALRSITYTNVAETAVGTRLVEFVVFDPTLDDSTMVSREIKLTDVPDAPEIDGVPTGVKIVQVGAATAWGDAVEISDLDSNSLTITVTATNGEILGLNIVQKLVPDVQITNIEPGTFTLHGNGELLTEWLKTASFTLTSAGQGSVKIQVTDETELTTTKTILFASQPVTPPVTPPVTTPTAPVDGVPVQVITAPDGTHTITVPVVTPGRTDDPTSPSNQLADIPVVESNGASVITVGAPVGSSFTATGPGGLLSFNNGLNFLPQFFSNSLSMLPTRVSDLFKGAGLNFMNGLDSAAQFAFQNIKPVAGTGGALVINGGAQTNTAKMLVIDTSTLPGSTPINLSNIDFAVIVGDAHVTGGAGANTVFGDDEHQFIVLGEDDDVIHGGGGNDTVGSLRGKDQIFGDAGNDVVYGGTNDDVLEGAAGNDQLNGGFGLDTAVQGGTLADYTVTLDGATVVLTHKTSGEIDRLLDVEVVNFASGQGLVVAHEAGDVAALTAAHPAAQLIELNLNRAVAGTTADDTITPELGIALNIDLGDGQDVVKVAGSRADVNLAVEAGNRVELTRLVDGAMLAFNNVEAIAFDGSEVTVLAHNHNEAVIGRAYELVLNRNVDTEGYGFWVKATQAGSSLQSVLSSILESSEFTGAHAGLSNADFTELLYQNGLNRAADADGKAFWVGALDAGVSRAQVAESIAASTEAVSVIGSTIDVTLVS